MDLKTRAKKLKSDIPAILGALKDKDTPIEAKIFAGITVVYALSPIDLVSDYYSRSALESNSVSEVRCFLY